MLRIPSPLLRVVSIIAIILVGMLKFSMAQNPDCNNSIGSIYGTPDENELGSCIMATKEMDGMYVAGVKDDSVLLLRIDLSGKVIWSRTFDIVPGMDEYPTSILVDSDGMIGVIGDAVHLSENSVFAFRYDPNTHQILWANEYNSSPDNFSNTIIEKGSGGNYLLSNNPHSIPVGANDHEILEVERNTGQVVPALSKNYRFQLSESLTILYHEDFIYGVGRYTGPGGDGGMRNTLAKFNADNGTPVWTKMGHIPANMTARLYGANFFIDNNEIISGYHGDPISVSLTNTKMYLQKTTLDGDLIWLKQYELPGANDVCLGMVKSGNGYVVLAGKRASPAGLILFKTDPIGNILWANEFHFSTIINGAHGSIGRPQLIAIGNILAFTAYGTNPSGGTDMIIVRTNLDGEPDMPCLSFEPVSIPVNAIENPAFFPVNPTMLEVIPTVTPRSPEGIVSEILPREECVAADTIYNHINATICEGDDFEGYSLTGTYSDAFITMEGCDSIRVLHLIVNACEPECGMANAIVFGAPDINERGYSLVATPEGDASYVTGIREDSLLLMKINLNGAVQWSRTFDLLPDSEEFPYSLIVDSEGMLALVGTTDELSVGGVVFVMRYNPYNHQVLWSKEFENVLNSVPGGIIQKGIGGNYLMVNDLNVFSGNHIDVELLELNINTGDVVPTLAKRYRLSNRESLFEIVYDDHFIYGTGRYKEDNSDFNFRNTLVKLNPDDGTQVWVKMGHIPNNITARLYGGHLLIDQNEIISGSYGDPSGTSITDTRLYLQKTDLDGNVIWLKQYNISQTNSFCYGIIKSGDGYVVLSGKRLPNTELVMFKIDTDGEVLWAKTYQFSSIIDEAHINPTLGGRGQSKVIQVGSQLIFTGYGVNTSGQTDLMLVRTDLEGNVDIPCVRSQNFPLTAIEIDPVFFSVSPDVFNVNPVVKSTLLQGLETLINPREECMITDTIYTSIEVSICAGEIFEGYNETGVYIDTFTATNTCDSIRTLHLTVNPLISFLLIEEICSGSSFEGYTQSGIFADTFNTINGCDSIRTLRLSVISCEAIVHYDLDACRSYMDDGSHMDYSEFTPAYPNVLSCADVSAGFLFRDFPQKHSCTPGIEGSPAMCVTTLNSCTYLPGNEASIVIEVTVDPSVDSLFRLTGLEFYEKSPATFNWIDGNSGPNNYPRFYGLRILKNGTEIFRQTNIQTTTSWTLQSFDFIEHDSFRIEETTVFRIELLPYCPVGNGALVSAWDVDEFKIYGGCIPVQDKKPMIFGHVHTKTGKEMSNIQMILSDHPSFVSTQANNTDVTGQYIFEDLSINQSYHLKGYKNDDVLNGVSTLDLIHIQKHLLGKEPFTSLHQYVAADVNRSGHVSVIDLLDLRKLLLGIYSAFPRNTSWRFGPLPQDFSGVDPDTFEETKNIASLTNDTNTVDFVGIKVGDLNDDVELDADAPKIISRNSEAMTLQMEDMLIKAGVPFSVDIKAGDYLMMSGIQFSMQLKNIDIVEMKSGAIPVTHQHFSLSDDGLFRLSWSADDAVNVSVGDVIFTITMESDQAGFLSDKFEILKTGLKAEAYAADDLKILPLELEYRKPIQNGAETGFLRIEPNPVHNYANIRFYLVSSGQAIIQFYDASGKLIYSLDKEYLQGEHLESVSTDKFHSEKGIIYCQLISNGYTEVQKFVIMN